MDDTGQYVGCVSQGAFTCGRINHCVETKVGNQKDGNFKVWPCVLWGVGKNVSPWERCKGNGFLMEKASIQVKSRGVFFESKGTGSFVFCFLNGMRIEGIFKLFGGKQQHED